MLIPIGDVLEEFVATTSSRLSGVSAGVRTFLANRVATPKSKPNEAETANAISSRIPLRVVGF